MDEVQQHHVKKSNMKGAYYACRWNQRAGNIQMMEIRTQGASGLERNTRALSEVKRNSVSYFGSGYMGMGECQDSSNWAI